MYPYEAVRYFVEKALTAFGAHKVIFPEEMGGCKTILKNIKGKVVCRVPTELEMIMGAPAVEEENIATFTLSHPFDAQKAKYSSGWAGMLVLDCESNKPQMGWIASRLDNGRRQWLVDKYKDIIQNAIDKLPPSLNYSIVLTSDTAWVDGKTVAQGKTKEEYDRLMEQLQKLLTKPHAAPTRNSRKKRQPN